MPRLLAALAYMGRYVRKKWIKVLAPSVDE